MKSLQFGLNLYYIYCIHNIRYYYPASFRILFWLILNISVKYRDVIFNSYTRRYIWHLYCMQFCSLFIFCIYLCSSLHQPTQLETLEETPKETPDIEDNSLNTASDVVSSLKMNRSGIFSLPERFVCHMFIATSNISLIPSFIL